MMGLLGDVVVRLVFIGDAVLLRELDLLEIEEFPSESTHCKHRETAGDAANDGGEECVLQGSVFDDGDLLLVEGLSHRFMQGGLLVLGVVFSLHGM